MRRRKIPADVIERAAKGFCQSPAGETYGHIYFASYLLSYLGVSLSDLTPHFWKAVSKERLATPFTPKAPAHLPVTDVDAATEHSIDAAVAEAHAHRDEIPPPCASAMGCLCAGHARGNPYYEPCDTRENPY